MSTHHTQRQYAAYKNAHHTTDNKTQQVVMIYDGIMRVVHQAKQAIIDNDIQKRFNLLDKASQVVLALQAALDFDNGGNVAKVLDHYYNTIYTKIHLINQTNNTADCDTLIEEVKSMRSAWQYVLEVTTPDSGAKPGKEERLDTACRNLNAVQVSI